MKKYLTIPASIILWFFEALVMVGFNWATLKSVASPVTTATSASPVPATAALSATHVLIAALASTIVFAAAASLLVHTKKKLSTTLLWATLGAITSAMALELARISGLALAVIIPAAVLTAVLYAQENGSGSLILARFGGSWRNY